MPGLREILDEVYLRTQRTRPTGARTALRSIQQSAEIIGIDDDVRLHDKSIPVTNGLIGWWSFDRVSISGSTAEDWYSNHDGTVSGAVLHSEGTVRECLKFDGSNDFVNMGDKTAFEFPSNTASFSVCANIRLNTAQRGSIVTKTDYSTQYEYILEVRADRKLRLVLSEDGAGGGGSVVVWETDSAVINTNTWQHVAATVNVASDTFKTYVDGSETASSHLTATTSITTLHAGTASLRVGGGEPNAPQYFPGRIDEVMLYNRDLEDFEVAHNAKLTRRATVGTFYPGEEFCI